MTPLSPVVLWDHLAVGPDPLEVPDELRVVHDGLAREEDVPAHGHVVRALGHHVKHVGRQPGLATGDGVAPSAT